ncbi:cell division protein FtsL [Alteribacillus iranensis]|uniref:Cell division protein FtsL n=1 Tax=Alteribacillus iranensis TaxID=930128 RepID=A0A1I2AB12_9BACI|nr:cell division protein FtsL [Alteribacillus iranensis]SFE41066.1 cell division protein FtsL [Alteribacillus iranensis]
MNNLAQQLQRQREEQQVVQKNVQHRIKGKVTKGEKVIVAAMMVAILIASVLVVTNYAKVYAQDREITSLQYSVQEQTEYNSSLQLEVSELSAPERIMHYAKEELGMSLDDNKVKVIPGQEEQNR